MNTVVCREETAEELRARYEREWKELCRRMKQVGRTLGGLARHAPLETRLRACQARLKVYQDVLEYFVEAPEVVPYEGPRAGAGRNHRRHGGGGEGPAQR